MSVGSGMIDLMPSSSRPLTDRETAILAFETRWWKYAGAKQTAIRDEFDVTAVRFYQELDALLDRPEALEHDPLLVNRLRRLRADRAHHRSSNRLRTIEQG